MARRTTNTPRVSNRQLRALKEYEVAGRQGDATLYRLKGGKVTVPVYDKAALTAEEIVELLRIEEGRAWELEANDDYKSPAPTPAAPDLAWLVAEDPAARSCGAFSEDTNGIRIADASLGGRSVLIMDNDLRELARMCAKRLRQAREAERKLAERAVAEAEERLRRARERAEGLR